MTTTPQTHLQTVINHWADLETALPTGGTGAAFGIGLRAYLRHLDQLDAEEVHAARELEVPAGQPPIRLRVHDTMHTVERVLVDCADQTASSVQRPAISPAPGHWPQADRERRNQLAAQDRDDPRRWSWTNPRCRTAPLAAVWLGHRLDNAPGPFTPLTALHRDHIATIAKGAAERVYAALDMTRRTQTAPFDCPHCRGTLRVHGGDGTPPAVRCRDCGWARTAVTDAA